MARVIPEPNSGCWLWEGATLFNGYGVIGRPGKHNGNVLTHRASWEVHVGSIPEGMYVLHRCDNRRCVLPDHLFLGTQADNLADMVSKGRSCRGERHWNYQGKSAHQS